jgi:uncharacterized protein (TIGR00106 family)
MKVLVDLSVVPLGVGLSLSKYVAACERVLKEAGLKTALHANGTNIEGDWDEVFAAVRFCDGTSDSRQGAAACLRHRLGGTATARQSLRGPI